jgi:ParB-like chromosome segregation protein Spo0J
MQIELEKIVSDPALQPRTGGIDGGHVASLMESVQDWPPIAVVQVGGRTVLLDGFHRLAAAQNLGRTLIDATLVDSPADGDLRALAFVLNATHGRPLSLTDRRAEAARLLRRVAETSDREIGRQCGLSQPTVAKIRAELEAGAQIEQTEVRVGRGGYQYAVGSREGDEVLDEQRERRRLAKFIARLAKTLNQSDDYPAWTSSGMWPRSSPTTSLTATST